MTPSDLLSNLGGVISVAPVVVVLVYAYLTEKREKQAAYIARARAEARLRAVLRISAGLPAEETEDGE
jgi:hypothetical protein